LDCTAWLLVSEKEQTLVHVRLYGMKVLTIEHGEYVINSGTNREEMVVVQVDPTMVARIN
jgi:hypothetical protein